MLSDFSADDDVPEAYCSSISFRPGKWTVFGDCKTTVWHSFILIDKVISLRCAHIVVEYLSAPVSETDDRKSN